MKETASGEDRETGDYTGAKLGMWFFLFTEIILFGALFLIYAVYREAHSADFQAAAAEMSVTIGAVNTFILLTSSLTMVLSISAVRRGARGRSMLFQAATLALGLFFLVNKYFEWSAHIHHGFYPGSPSLPALGNGQTLYFGLYYVMTGVHGLHILAGMAAIGGTLYLTKAGKITGSDYIMLENTGLFWHLVDVIWIYLFPLFYLIK